MPLENLYLFYVSVESLESCSRSQVTFNLILLKSCSKSDWLYEQDSVPIRARDFLFATYSCPGAYKTSYTVGTVSFFSAGEAASL
jgi:hypothetical protein